MYTVTLERIQNINSTTSTFWFTKPHGWEYIAGQFIELVIHHNTPDNRGDNRWFTLSSSPTEPLLAITTKRSNSMSSFKQALFGLQHGDTVMISDAMGDFVLPILTKRPLIFVAAGIGTTPVRSMMKYITDREETRTIDILITAKTVEDYIFKDVLSKLIPEPRIYIGRHTLTTQEVLTHAQMQNDPYIYLSGPERFTEHMFHELKTAGVPSSRLITDYFHGYN